MSLTYWSVIGIAASPSVLGTPLLGKCLVTGTIFFSKLYPFLVFLGTGEPNTQVFHFYPRPLFAFPPQCCVLTSPVNVVSGDCPRDPMVRRFSWSNKSLLLQGMVSPLPSPGLGCAVVGTTSTVKFSKGTDGFAELAEKHLLALSSTALVSEWFNALKQLTETSRKVPELIGVCSWEGGMEGEELPLSSGSKRFDCHCLSCGTMSWTISSVKTSSLMDDLKRVNR